MKLPLWQLLMEKGLASSRKEAEALVLAGKVVVEDQRASKPGNLIQNHSKIRLKGSSKYVSRAGEKLEKAIKAWKLEDQVCGSYCLDIGSSTGGFTDCLLQFEANLVVAVDVGTNQLAWSIRTDKRVISLEKTDIRKFQLPPNKGPFDFIVTDVSFISLCTIASKIKELMSDSTICLLLIKPQFELPKEDVQKGGIVENEQLHQKAIQKVEECFEEIGISMIDHMASPVKGRFGNQEFVGMFKLK